VSIGTFHPATPTDLDRVSRTLLATRVFPDAEALHAAWEATPWRIQVTENGDLAVLEPWRDHLLVLAVVALYCSERLIPSAMRQMRRVARAGGFSDLVSPPAPLEQAYAYEAAGMHVFERVSTLVGDSSQVPPDAYALPDVSIRAAVAQDAAALLAIDARCFDEFWRYDLRHLERFMSTQRLVVAECEEGPIGYTLSTIQLGDGLLGRVAVIPEWRRRGVGTMLVRDVLAYVRGAGAKHATLCTQTDNAASRALYARTGFRDTGRLFVFLRFGPSG
jgi:ribosomal-protein-alanine N-acetyltransferase